MQAEQRLAGDVTTATYLNEMFDLERALREFETGHGIELQTYLVLKAIADVLLKQQEQVETGITIANTVKGQVVKGVNSVVAILIISLVIELTVLIWVIIN